MYAKTTIFGILCIVVVLITLVSCKLHCSKDLQDPMLGDVVTLYCKKDITADNDTFRLVWKSPKTESVGTENYVLSMGQTAKLTSTITLEEEDNYQKFTCKERRAKTTADMCELMPLKIPSAVMVTATLQPTYQTANVTFSCESSMVPRVNRYSWSFDGKPVQNGDRFILLENEKKLIVKNVMLDDHKKIATCTSFNKLGMDKSGSNIIMVDPDMEIPSVITSDKELFILGIGAGFAAMATLVIMFCVVFGIVKKRMKRNMNLTDSEKEDEVAFEPLDGQKSSRCNPYASSDLAVTTNMSERCLEKERQLELEAESDQERRYFTLEKPPNIEASKHESVYESIDEERL